MADRTPTLPGLTPEGDEPFNPVRDRFGRLRGPWKKPARFPCDFHKANGMVCDLESVRLWCGMYGPAGPAWHWHEPSYAVSCSGDMVRHQRCALHPVVEGL